MTENVDSVASAADSLTQLLLPLFENQKLHVFGLEDENWKVVRLSTTGHLPLDSFIPARDSGLWSRQIFLLKSEWDELQDLWQQLFFCKDDVSVSAAACLGNLGSI